MAHISTTETGGGTVASAQLSQEYPYITVTAADTFTSNWMLTRGAPRVLVHAYQDQGVLGSIVSLEASISDDDTGGRKSLVIDSFVVPLTTPMMVTLPLPTKLCRITITAPNGQAVRVSVALMASQ